MYRLWLSISQNSEFKKKKKSLHQDYIDGEKPSTQLLHTVVIDNQKVMETLHLTECCDGTEM